MRCMLFGGGRGVVRIHVFSFSWFLRCYLCRISGFISANLRLKMHHLASRHAFISFPSLPHPCCKERGISRCNTYSTLLLLFFEPSLPFIFNSPFLFHSDAVDFYFHELKLFDFGNWIHHDTTHTQNTSTHLFFLLFFFYVCSVHTIPLSGAVSTNCA